MQDFHQTKMGYRFFMGQLPKLIDALERIANALEVIIPEVAFPTKKEPPEGDPKNKKEEQTDEE